MNRKKQNVFSNRKPKRDLIALYCTYAVGVIFVATAVFVITQ